MARSVKTSARDSYRLIDEVIYAILKTERDIMSAVKPYKLDSIIGSLGDRAMHRYLSVVIITLVLALSAIEAIARDHQCDSGVSCQSVGTVEQQQYPPAEAEAWVQSVTDGGLVDVPLDDPRWGDRERGEVYARENDRFIVWWWPHGGNATFDPTKLGGLARWHDYRLSQPDGKPRSGAIGLSSGMDIQFMDSAGGVSIFERVDGTRLSTSRDFLANFTNPEQFKVPDDGIYPNGKRMLFGWYSGSDNNFERMKSAGFSTDGPQYHGGLGEAHGLKWQRGAAAGMKNWYRLTELGGSGWKYILEKMRTAEGQTHLKNRLIAGINKVLSNPELDENIFAWYGYEEEPMGQNGNSLQEQRAYIRFVHDIIKDNDPRKRPFAVSERSDSDRENMIGNQCWQDIVMKQNYLIKSNGYGGDPNMRYLMHQWILDEKAAADINDIDPACPTNNGRKRAVYSTLSAYIDPEDVTLQNEAWLRKVITHDVYTQLAAGVHGFNMWAWNSSYEWPDKTKPIQEEIYLDVTGFIIREGLDYVFLWGDDRDDIAMEMVQGPTTISWRKHLSWYTAPSITMRNIQHGDHRYLLLVNESNEVVRPKLSGFPAGLRILDMITGKGDDLGDSVTPTIQPLGVQMYRISR